MSDWTSRRDNIEAVVTGTVSVSTITPGLEPADKGFDSGDFPVLMVGAFVEASEELAWQQQETTTNVALLYWNRVSQDQMSTDADAIRDAINTASGTGAVVSREMGEIPDKGIRVVRFEVEDKAINGSSIVFGSTPSTSNLIESHNLFIPFPGSGIDGLGDGSENVRFELDFAGTVEQATVKTEAGTLNYSLQLADVAVAGLEHQTVTTTEATDTATAANTFAAGDEFKVAISGAANAQEFRLTIRTART